MATPHATENIAEPPQHAVNAHELTEMLIRHFGIHEGKYALAIHFRIAVGPVPGPSGIAPVPGAMMGIEGVGIQPVSDDANGVGVSDAAVVNPRPKALPRSSKPSKRKAVSK